MRKKNKVRKYMIQATVFIVACFCMLGLMPSVAYAQGDGDSRPVLAVYGDSISAYKGYTDGPYYGPGMSAEGGYDMAEDNMYWSIYARDNGYRLGYAYGKTMAGLTDAEGSWLNLYNQDRVDKLGCNGTPDTIIIYEGTNDITVTQADVNTFWDKYMQLLDMVHSTYPMARIICVGPYYLGENTVWIEKVDSFNFAIRTIAEYYGYSYVDLRGVINVYSLEDCDRIDSLHPNENGQAKIANKITETIGNVDFINVYEQKDYDGYQYIVRDFHPDAQYRMVVTDTTQGIVDYRPWQSDNVLRWNISRTYNQYRVDIEIDYEGDGYVDFTRTNNYSAPSALQTDAAVWLMDNQPDYVRAGLVNWVGNQNQVDFRWQEYDAQTGQWLTVSDWKQGDSILEWNPCKSGDFMLVGQVPYNGFGGGYLIGLSSYNNLNNNYRYEMVIMDCSKYAAGDPCPWVYSTGYMDINGGNTAWALWQPQYGYYLTLFRLYDANGNMLDYRCYGFANV